MSERSERGIIHRLYNGETRFDFISRWKLWFGISTAVIVVGLGSLALNGLNLGIDFEGGVSWETPAGDASEADVTAAVESAGVADPSVQTLGTSSGDVIRVQSAVIDAEIRAAATEGIAEVTGADPADISFSEVGPSWGDEISSKALRALVVFLVLVSLYITLRFEWKMAAATLAALIHDILITVGVYAFFGFPVTPATVIAILTILGYSIYDGIVVFDRVDENAKKVAVSGDANYSDTVNRSMNEVLMRTLNTSITALMPILSLLIIGSFILGATTLEEFALALFVGLMSGAYSSIFIASPALALLKEREPKWQAIRRKLDGRGIAPAAAPLRPGVAATLVDEGVPADRPAPGPVQPRGRKKGKRR